MRYYVLGGQGDPTYIEVQRRIIRNAAKRYGNRVVDRLQPAFSSEDSRILEVGNLVRKSIWKNGQPGKASFKDSKKASAGTNNWSEDLYRIARIYPGRAWSNTTYALAQTNNDGTVAAEINGKWTRQALLSVPEETLQNLDGDDTDDDNDNDGAPSGAGGGAGGGAEEREGS